MQSSGQRLKFLVQLNEAPEWDKATEPARARLIDQIWRFAGQTKEGGSALVAPDDLEAIAKPQGPEAKRVYDAVRNAARKVVAGLIGRRDRNEGYGPDAFVSADGARIAFTRPARPGQPARLVVSGSLLGMFVLRLVELLATVGSDGLRSNTPSVLRACLTCRQPFIRVGRREHCERKECAAERQRVYWQKYRKTDAHERARKKQYEKEGWTRGTRRANVKKGREQ